MNQQIDKPLSAKEFAQEHDEWMTILKRKMLENSSLVVDDELGQSSLDLGINIPIDVIIPPSKEEIEWHLKP